MKSHIAARTGPRATDPELTRLIIEEIQQLRLRKEEFDQDFPEHRKYLSHGELWDIARNKIMDDLCAAYVAREEGVVVIQRGYALRGRSNRSLA
jgi:hypothetical protein